MLEKLNIFKKGKSKKELLSNYELMLEIQGEKLLRVPEITYGVTESFEKIENEFSSRGYRNPYEICIMVGSLSIKDNLGNIKEFIETKNNFHDLSEKEIEGEIFKVASRHADCDLFLVVRSEIKPYYRRELARAFMATLPKLTFIKNFDYEVHEDCVAPPSKMLSNFMIAKNGNLPLLLQHEREVFERSSEKEKVPVILAKSKFIHRQIEEEVEEHVNHGYLRTLQDYINTTWKNYAKDFKEMFPKKWESVVNEIKVEIENFAPSYKEKILSSYENI